MSVDSPTYAALSRHIAKTEALLSLARECRPGQPIPNLLFAAAKRLVADAPDTPLAGFYRPGTVSTIAIQTGRVSGRGGRPCRSPVKSEGRWPRLPAQFPNVSFRAGIDLHPINLADREQYRWLQALIWPDHADRAALLANARRVWLQQPPRMEAGDALQVLPVVIAQVPTETALCVFHCHALYQFPAAARSAFSAILRAASRSRPVYHVSSEGERLVVTRLDDGQSTTLLSALRSAHGRWVEW